MFFPEVFWEKLYSTCVLGVLTNLSLFSAETDHLCSGCEDTLKNKCESKKHCTKQTFLKPDYDTGKKKNIYISIKYSIKSQLLMTCISLVKTTKT